MTEIAACILITLLNKNSSDTWKDKEQSINKHLDGDIYIYIYIYIYAHTHKNIHIYLYPIQIIFLTKPNGGIFSRA